MWRHGPDGPEVLLIHRPRRDDWSLAKGKRDPGEQLPQTAVREVVEETGIRPVLGGRLRSVSYLAGGRPKHVHYWAAAEPVPRGYPNLSFVPNHEVDGIEWLTLPDAYERLSYPDDVIVLRDFAKWPHRTVPFMVLRHASAGRKAGLGRRRPAPASRRPGGGGRAGPRAPAGLLRACPRGQLTRAALHRDGRAVRRAHRRAGRG